MILPVEGALQVRPINERKYTSSAVKGFKTNFDFEYTVDS